MELGLVIYAKLINLTLNFKIPGKLGKPCGENLAKEGFFRTANYRNGLPWLRS